MARKRVYGIISGAGHEVAEELTHVANSQSVLKR
jgi:hypothetical protein